MPPIALPRAPSGEIIRKISRSISELLSSTPHSSSPSFARRAITNIASHFTTRHTPASAPVPASILKVAKRQTQILAIPTTYEGLNAGPAPGTVVGITLGAVGGFLLLLWLIYTCANFGGGAAFSSFGWGRGGRDTVIEEEVIRRRSRSASRSRSVSRSMSEVSRPAPEPRRRESRRTTVVEETRRTSTRREPEPEVEREEDIVEVTEEHSPVRRKGGSRRESNRVSSGFRTVNPAEFAGGDRPVRKVSRR